MSNFTSQALEELNEILFDNIDLDSKDSRPMSKKLQSQLESFLQSKLEEAWKTGYFEGQQDTIAAKKFIKKMETK